MGGRLIIKSVELYAYLENDFIFKELRDEWAKYMPELAGYLTAEFKERSMGLVCDFTQEINKVYSAVFPTGEVMQKILDEEFTDALLFVHHPSIWDIRKSTPFYQMESVFLEKFKENRIAIYNLHMPLDNFGEYGASKNLAEALDLEVEKPFLEFNGALVGVFGKTKCKSIEELRNKFSQALGHETKLYPYGDAAPQDGRVAVIAGGGNNKAAVAELLKNDVNVLITGVTAKNGFSAPAHKLEQETCQ